MVATGDIVFTARHNAKDGKWAVLVETDRDCFVEEDRALGVALAKAQLRVQGF